MWPKKRLAQRKRAQRPIRPSMRSLSLPCVLLLSGVALAQYASPPVVPLFPADFDPVLHSGAAAQYFDAPSQYGIPVEIPQGCVVEQAAYIVRHAS